MAQDGPKAAPRGGGKGPRWAPGGARRAQERPKVAPGAARKTGTPKNGVLGSFWGLFWGPGRASGGHPGLSGGALFLDPFLDPSWGRQRPENFDFGPYVFQKSKGGCKPKYPKRTPKLGFKNHQKTAWEETFGVSKPRPKKVRKNTQKVYCFFLGGGSPKERKGRSPWEPL